MFGLVLFSEGVGSNAHANPSITLADTIGVVVVNQCPTQRFGLLIFVPFFFLMYGLN